MRCAVLLAMWVLLFVRQASAQDAVPVALSYSAPSSCPTQGHFVARLRMHTQRVQLSSEPDAVTLEVAIVRTARGFSGTLAVAQPGRPSGTRTFEGAECADVVWALALSAALSIDPEANLTVSSEGGESEGDAGERSDAEATTSSEDPSVSGANAPDGSRSEGAKEPPVDQRETPGGELPPEGAGGTALWSLGPVLSVSFAFEPKAAVGGGLVLAVRDTSARQLLPLELALRLEYLGTRWTRGSDPVVLDWWSANLLACPIRVGEAPTVLLCGVGQAGVIHAAGVDIEQAEAASRSFFSVGIGLGARQRVSEHWELSAALDFKIPLVDRSFALGSDFESSDFESSDSESPDHGANLDVVSSSRPIAAGFSLGAVYGF